MDEGVAGYVSYNSLKGTEYGEKAQSWNEQQLQLARDAVSQGTWIPVSSLALVYDWNLAQASAPGLPVAESYVVVSYLVETYGLDKCITTFQTVSHNGGSAESGLSLIIGISQEQLDRAARDWIASAL
jgi:hypothetical protein